MPHLSAEIEQPSKLCTECQVCGTALPAPTLSLGDQPLCDDLVEIGDSRFTQAFPIAISLCSECLTAHQIHHVRKELLFPQQYHYRPKLTKNVVNGMIELVDECNSRYGDLTGKLVCDVGCNDGTLLTKFRERGARTCGIEPTGAAKEAQRDGHPVIHDFFSTDSVQSLLSRTGHPDIVTFTNVFAHIEDLHQAIVALNALIDDQTIVVIENHYLGTVLETLQFDTFYHEHPRTYSFRSFQAIALQLGAKIEFCSFPERYGGNIRVHIRRCQTPARGDAPAIDPRLRSREDEFESRLAGLQGLVDRWKAEAREQILDLAQNGILLSGKSFPGRASILVNLLGTDLFEGGCVYEQPESLKIGHYVPGSRIPIVSDARWISGADTPKALVLWGWHIAGELSAYLRSHGFAGRLFVPLPEFREVT